MQCLMQEEGIACVDVNKSMLQFVRGAHSRYKQCLQLKRGDTADNVHKAADRKRAADEIKVLKLKKAKLTETMAHESGNIDRDITELQKMLHN